MLVLRVAFWLLIAPNHVHYFSISFRIKIKNVTQIRMLQAFEILRCTAVGQRKSQTQVICTLWWIVDIFFSYFHK